MFHGQSSEVYGHVRRAIEGVGIAYLSTSDSNVTELYRNGDEWTFFNLYKTSKLFPKQNRLTRDLNEMISEASRKLHSNLNSITEITEESDGYEDERHVFHFKFSIIDSRSIENVLSV